MKSKAYPEGSMISGYLLYLFKMMAFSFAKLSEGNPFLYHKILSEGTDRNSINDNSFLNSIFDFDI